MLDTLLRHRVYISPIGGVRRIETHNGSISDCLICRKEEAEGWRGGSSEVTAGYTAKSPAFGVLAGVVGLLVFAIVVGRRKK